MGTFDSAEPEGSSLNPRISIRDYARGSQTSAISFGESRNSQDIIKGENKVSFDAERKPYATMDA